MLRRTQVREDSILLRSLSVDGVYQEIWGVLLAYNLVRVEIARRSHQWRYVAAPGCENEYDTSSPKKENGPKIGPFVLVKPKDANPKPISAMG